MYCLFGILYLQFEVFEWYVLPFLFVDNILIYITCYEGSLNMTVLWCTCNNTAPCAKSGHGKILLALAQAKYIAVRSFVDFDGYSHIIPNNENFFHWKTSIPALKSAWITTTQSSCNTNIEDNGYHLVSWYTCIDLNHVWMKITRKENGHWTTAKYTYIPSLSG